MDDTNTAGESISSHPLLSVRREIRTYSSDLPQCFDIAQDTEEATGHKEKLSTFGVQKKIS